MAQMLSKKKHLKDLCPFSYICYSFYVIHENISVCNVAFIITDPDYQKFLDSINNPVIEPATAPEAILEEIEAREKELKRMLMEMI